MVGNLKGKPSKHDSTVWRPKCFQIIIGFVQKDFCFFLKTTLKIKKKWWRVIEGNLLHLQVDKVTCPLLHLARLVCGSLSQIQGISLSSPSLRYWTPESLTTDEGLWAASNTHKEAGGGKQNHLSVVALLLWKRTSLPLTARGDISPLSADAEDRFLIGASSLHHVPLFALILHLGIWSKHLLVTPVDDHSVRDPRGLVTRTKALCRRRTLAPLTRPQVHT